MKKRYIVPSQFAVKLQEKNMMALSLGGPADGSTVLGKENDDWDFMDDEDESFIPKNPKYFK